LRPAGSTLRRLRDSPPRLAAAQLARPAVLKCRNCTDGTFTRVDARFTGAPIFQTRPLSHFHTPRTCHASSAPVHSSLVYAASISCAGECGVVFSNVSIESQDGSRIVHVEGFSFQKETAICTFQLRDAIDWPRRGTRCRLIDKRAHHIRIESRGCRWGLFRQPDERGVE
jgi:hypothetical protein